MSDSVCAYCFVFKECFKVLVVHKQSWICHHCRTKKRIFCDTFNFKSDLGTVEFQSEFIPGCSALSDRHIPCYIHLALRHVTDDIVVSVKEIQIGVGNIAYQQDIGEIHKLVSSVTKRLRCCIYHFFRTPVLNIGACFKQIFYRSFTIAVMSEQIVVCHACLFKIIIKTAGYSDNVIYTCRCKRRAEYHEYQKYHVHSFLAF